MVTVNCVSSNGESTVIYGEFNNAPDACHFARLVYQFDKFLTIIITHNGERQNTWQFIKESENRSAIGQ